MIMTLHIQIARLRRLYGISETHARLIAGLYYGEAQ